MKLNRYKGCKGTKKGIGPKSLENEHTILVKNGTSKKIQYQISNILANYYTNTQYEDDFHLNNSEKNIYFITVLKKHLDIFISKFNGILYIKEGKIIDSKSHLYLKIKNNLYVYEKEYKKLTIRNIKENEYQFYDIEDGKKYLEEKQKNSKN